MVSDQHFLAYLLEERRRVQLVFLVEDALQDQILTQLLCRIEVVALPMTLHANYLWRESHLCKHDRVSGQVVYLDA